MRVQRIPPRGHSKKSSATDAGDTARRLERATGLPERLWNNLESRYQEHQARLADVERL